MLFRLQIVLSKISIKRTSTIDIVSFIKKLLEMKKDKNVKMLNEQENFNAKANYISIQILF